MYNKSRALFDHEAVFQRHYTRGLDLAINTVLDFDKNIFFIMIK